VRFWQGDTLVIRRKRWRGKVEVEERLGKRPLKKLAVIRKPPVGSSWVQKEWDVGREGSQEQKPVKILSLKAYMLHSLCTQEKKSKD